MRAPNKLPILVNLEAYHGDEFVRYFTLWYFTPTGAAEVLNTAGWTGRMHVRAHRNAPDVLLELTTENGRLKTGIGSGGGRQWCIELRVPAHIMAGEQLRGLAGVYDLQLTDTSGRRKTFYFGDFCVEADVTR